MLFSTIPNTIYFKQGQLLSHLSLIFLTDCKVLYMNCFDVLLLCY